MINNIFKRVVFVVIVKFLVLFLLMFAIFRISTNEHLEEVSNEKNFYKVKIKSERGSIYDCRGFPLIELKKKLIAAIVPSESNFVKLLNIIPENKRKQFIVKFYSKFPFTMEVTKKIKEKGVKIFEILKQSFNYIPACHTVGYLKEGHGICGIEKSFDSLLGSANETEIIYQKDASGRVISNKNPEFYDKSYYNSYGVQLHIDKRIQKIVEEISKKYISKGAVLVTEVPNCEIRASVSLPDFSLGDIDKSLKSKNSDFLNRVNSSYNLGSIFKLVTSACLIESGMNISKVYDCKGAINFKDKTKIRCFNGVSHGKVDLEHAVSLSCNTMFADLSKKIDPKNFLNLAKNLGFGKNLELSPGMISDSGNLPNLEDLKDEKKMAMFSFGQGKLMATPLQVAGLINLISCGGVYHEPKLVKGIINKDGSFENYHFNLPKRVLKFKTTEYLKKFMRASIISGTGKYANSSIISSAAKTSTAETGMFENGERINHSWIAGFFPFENPRYCIVILVENSDQGGKVCGPIFKEIGEKISKFSN